jgi:hypothetical protein
MTSCSQRPATRHRAAISWPMPGAACAGTRLPVQPALSSPIQFRPARRPRSGFTMSRTICWLSQPRLDAGSVSRPCPTCATTCQARASRICGRFLFSYRYAERLSGVFRFFLVAPSGFVRIFVFLRAHDALVLHFRILIRCTVRPIHDFDSLPVARSAVPLFWIFSGHSARLTVVFKCFAVFPFQRSREIGLRMALGPPHNTLGQSSRRVARGVDSPRAARQGRRHGVLLGCRVAQTSSGAV